MAVTSESKRARRRNPRGQGDRLREELLAAATAIVTADGNARGLSLSSVARAVGIAATSVYLHFDDIEALKRALVDRGYAELNRRRADETRTITDPAQLVLARWHAYAHFAVGDPGLYRLMFGSELPPAMAFGAPESPGRQAFMSGVSTIAAAQQAGAITASDDPFRLATLTWAAVHGLVSLRIDRPNFPWPPLDELLDQTLRRLLMMPRQMTR